MGFAGQVMRCSLAVHYFTRGDDTEGALRMHASGDHGGYLGRRESAQAGQHDGECDKQSSAACVRCSWDIPPR